MKKKNQSVMYNDNEEIFRSTKTDFSNNKRFLNVITYLDSITKNAYTLVCIVSLINKHIHF